MKTLYEMVHDGEKFNIRNADGFALDIRNIAIEDHGLDGKEGAFIYRFVMATVLYLDRECNPCDQTKESLMKIAHTFADDEDNTEYQTVFDVLMNEAVEKDDALYCAYAMFDSISNRIPENFIKILEGSLEKYFKDDEEEEKADSDDMVHGELVHEFLRSLVLSTSDTEDADAAFSNLPEIVKRMQENTSIERRIKVECDNLYQEHASVRNLIIAAKRFNV